jgi:hypothetical protein
MHGILKHLQGGVVVAVTLTLIGTVSWADPKVPDAVQLNSLSQLYAGVEFDHAMHVSLADGCATCHHHTTGSAPLKQECTHCHAATGQMSAKVACGACHGRETFSAQYLREKDQDAPRYHTDKLALKGAYHQSCTGCHQDMGGPTGCQDCHARNEAGDAFYHAGNFAPTGGKTGGAGH